MTTSTTIAHVLLPYALEGPYSYAVPEDMRVGPGCFVVVPLGSREVIGVVWEKGGGSQPPAKLRPIAEVFDQSPLPKLHMDFIDWIAGYYLVSAGMVLRMCLRVPSALGQREGRRAFQPSGNIPRKLTAARSRVLDVLRNGPPLEPRDIAELAGVSASVVKGLVKEGALNEVALAAFARFTIPNPLEPSDVALTDAQRKAADQLAVEVRRQGASVTLIDGVTGSGKTEVYFEGMAHVLAQDKQVLLLVPEIALTAQFIERVEKRFSAQPAEWHSDLRPRERERVWRAVASGDARILVGARSALFLPWKNLGLIVVDEEHESAFKQEDGVTYHARDMAVVYGALGSFPVILSSATPSLETLANVDRGRYHRLILQDRVGRAMLPAISLIDMRKESPAAGKWLSEPLTQAIEETLAAGDQALLFLNRRGYAPLTLCRHCGFRLECPNCDSSLVEHRFRRVLICHHCGHQEPVPKTCPSCGVEGHLVPCGPGVERVAEEARSRFPEARMTILSSDLQRGTSLRETLREIADGKHNLIVGTQLVAKGHHFPQLTLAGVVDADFALETTDPRAGERTFQLLCQVSGRAGRGDKRGRGLIQTFNPQNPLMVALETGDAEGFIAEEKSMRERALLPPYGRLAAIIVSGSEAQETEALARRLAAEAPITEGVELLGPAPAPLAVVRARYRWRLLIRAARNIDLQAYLRVFLGRTQPKASLRVDIDIDPYSFL